MVNILTQEELQVVTASHSSIQRLMIIKFSADTQVEQIFQLIKSVLIAFTIVIDVNLR